MTHPVLTIGFIGAGNLAWNLAHNLPPNKFSIEQVISRTDTSVKSFADKFNVPLSSRDLKSIHPDLDLVFISSNDHAIAEIAKNVAPFAGKNTVFVHCSGSTDVNDLTPLGDQVGVIYPLQTFTKDHLTSIQDVPVFIEFTDQTRQVIEKVAHCLSSKVTHLGSEDRLKIHLGAVFACNYTNLMYLIANEVLLSTQGVDFKVYEPLLKESLTKALKYSPHEAQTGPARRRDAITIEKHLKLLENQNSGLKKLYLELAQKIQERF